MNFQTLFLSCTVCCISERSLVDSVDMSCRTEGYLNYITSSPYVTSVYRNYTCTVNAESSNQFSFNSLSCCCNWRLSRFLRRNSQRGLAEFNSFSGRNVPCTSTKFLVFFNWTKKKRYITFLILWIWEATKLFFRWTGTVVPGKFTTLIKGTAIEQKLIMHIKELSNTCR